MRGLDTIQLSIDQLGISGLSEEEGARLETALQNELELRLMAGGFVHALGPLKLGDLQLSLPERSAPEVMGAKIAAQIASAITGPTSSSAPGATSLARGGRS